VQQAAQLEVDDIRVTRVTQQQRQHVGVVSVYSIHIVTQSLSHTHVTALCVNHSLTHSLLRVTGCGS